MENSHSRLRLTKPMPIAGGWPQTHYENFTVGSRLMPKALRPHVYTIYGFCRTVDDLGDEFTEGDALLPAVSAET